MGLLKKRLNNVNIPLRHDSPHNINYVGNRRMLTLTRLRRNRRIKADKARKKGRRKDIKVNHYSRMN